MFFIQGKIIALYRSEKIPIKQLEPTTSKFCPATLFVYTAVQKKKKREILNCNNSVVSRSGFRKRSLIKVSKICNFFTIPRSSDGLT